jgi:LytS/YehU family sensor histidine kinase
MPLKIRVNANIVNEALKIEVSNSGNWVKTSEKDRSDGTGTGLENIKRRLDSVFPNKYNIKIEDEDNWVHIIIQINKDAIIQSEKVI